MGLTMNSTVTVKKKIGGLQITKSNQMQKGLSSNYFVLLNATRPCVSNRKRASNGLNLR